jgi:hypothetical protein
MLSRIFRETENAAVNRKRQIDTLKIFNDKYVLYHILFILPGAIVERMNCSRGEFSLVFNHLNGCVASLIV